MGLELTFRVLASNAADLDERLSQLRLSVVEDRPMSGDIALVDRLADALDELAGRVAEASRAAREGVRAAAAAPPKDDAAAAALQACQGATMHLLRRFWATLAEHSLLQDLSAVGQERGGEWGAWARSVRDDIESSTPLFIELVGSLFACSRELVERSGRRSISVSSTSIGQHISIPDAGAIGEGTT